MTKRRRFEGTLIFDKKNMPARAISANVRIQVFH